MQIEFLIFNVAYLRPSGVFTLKFQTRVCNKVRLPVSSDRIKNSSREYKLLPFSASIPGRPLTMNFPVGKSRPTRNFVLENDIIRRREVFARREKLQELATCVPCFLSCVRNFSYIRISSASLHSRVATRISTVLSSLRFYFLYPRHSLSVFRGKKISAAQRQQCNCDMSRSFFFSFSLSSSVYNVHR